MIVDFRVRWTHPLRGFRSKQMSLTIILDYVCAYVCALDSAMLY